MCQLMCAGNVVSVGPMSDNGCMSKVLYPAAWQASSQVSACPGKPLLAWDCACPCHLARPPDLQILTSLACRHASLHEECPSHRWLSAERVRALRAAAAGRCAVCGLQTSHWGDLGRADEESAHVSPLVQACFSTVYADQTCACCSAEAPVSVRLAAGESQDSSTTRPIVIFLVCALWKTSLCP